MNQDAVLRARLLVLGSNRRVLRGPEALWVYRVLTRESPEVYGSKLAYVLVEASGSPRLSGLPQLRLALLQEAIGVAEALDGANPYREKVLTMALDARRQERAGSAVDTHVRVERPNEE